MEKGNANLHFLDRYLGIPLVVVLGIFKGFKRTITQDFHPKRIAILNISSIGDNVLMSGPIKDLKQRYPTAQIVLFCGETNYGVVNMLPHLDEVHKLPVTRVWECFGLIKHHGTFDLLIDFGPWPRLNAVLSSFFKATIKIGFRSIGQWRHFVYDYPVPHSTSKHELENFRALLEPLGLRGKSVPQLLVPEQTSKAAEEYIVFHPWPGGYKSYMKEWPVENWLQLAGKLQGTVKVYVTGAKADLEATGRLVARSNGQMVSMAGKLNLVETAQLVKNAGLLVTVNTGIMHIGAALGVPMVALHGPTSVDRWGPVSTHALNVFPKSDACGYLHFGYEYHKSTVDCMALITVEEVYQAMQTQRMKYAG